MSFYSRARTHIAESKVLGTTLDKVRNFKHYASTMEGFREFFGKELITGYRLNEHQRIAVICDEGSVELPTLQLLQALLAPFYYCDWDQDGKNLLEDVLNNNLSVTVIVFNSLLVASFVPTRTVSPSVITLEMIPSDWVDLVEHLIDTEKLDITKYGSVGELEEYVDFTLLRNASVNGSVAAIVPERFEPDPSEAVLKFEERLELAKCLCLNADDFTTKSQALELSASGNGRRG